jgi:hypothetical protein
MSGKGQPRWPAEGPGAEALWRGEKGDKGEPGITSGARRGIAYLFIFIALIAAISLIYTTLTADHLHVELQSQCQFDADLGGVPVSLNPATGRASVLGVKIVSDSRVAWHQAGCPGRLAPPSPSVARWAKFYHLPTG